MHLNTVETLIEVDSIQINDGQWHRIVINGNFPTVNVSVDGTHSKQGNTSGATWDQNAEPKLYFGGGIWNPNSTDSTGVNVANGFQGCMKGLKLNGYELKANGQSIGVISVKTHGVVFHCHDVVIEGELLNIMIKIGSIKNRSVLLDRLI